MQTLVIPIAFLVLATLLLWIVIGCSGRWWLKLALIFVTFGVSSQIWLSLDSYLGHPRSMTFKAMSGQTAYLFWAKIDEPSNADPGAIYMWLRPSRDIVAGALAFVSNEPKLYKFPYDREFHEATQNFIAQILQLRGAPIEIQFAQQQEQRKGGAKKDEMEMGPGPAKVYVLPPARLPAKLSSINQ